MADLKTIRIKRALFFPIFMGDCENGFLTTLNSNSRLFGGNFVNQSVCSNLIFNNLFFTLRLIIWGNGRNLHWTSQEGYLWQLKICWINDYTRKTVIQLQIRNPYIQIKSFYMNFQVIEIDIMTESNSTKSKRKQKYIRYNQFVIYKYDENEKKNSTRILDENVAVFFCVNMHSFL